MSKHIWRIAGYDGKDEIFSQSIPDMTAPEVKVLLQRLASRHLTASEVVSASLRNGMKGHAPHLEVAYTGVTQFGLMTTGTDFHYTARRENAERP